MMNDDVKLPVFVLCGGLGTRIRSVIGDIPKALAPVGETTFLSLLLRNLKNQGVEHVFLLAGYRSDLILDHVRGLPKKTTNNCYPKIEVIAEKYQLGTHGALVHAVGVTRYTGEFIVLNGDTWLGEGIQAIANAKGCTMATVSVMQADRYGSLVIDSGKVVGFNEKREGLGEASINAGLYKLDKRIISVGNEAVFSSLEKDVFPRLALEGNLSALELGARFIDIGVPSDYRRFLELYKKGFLDQ